MDEDKAHRMRVLWNKGRNFYTAFFTELDEVRREIGEKELPGWTLWKLGIDLDRALQYRRLLNRADELRVNNEFAGARHAEQRAKAETRRKNAVFKSITKKRTKKTPDQKNAAKNERARQARMRKRAEMIARGPLNAEVAALLAGSANLRHDLMALGKCYYDIKRLVIIDDVEGMSEDGNVWTWPKWVNRFITCSPNRRVANKPDVVDRLVNMHEATLPEDQKIPQEPSRNKSKRQARTQAVIDREAV